MKAITNQKGDVFAHILNTAEMQSREVQIIYLLDSGVKINNNESQFLGSVLQDIEDARSKGKGLYLSVKQLTWLTDILSNYEDSVAAFNTPSDSLPEPTLADAEDYLKRALDILIYLRSK